MKDAYTFDRDREALDASYEQHARAYDRIFDRLGLEWYASRPTSGMMGGFGAHEYMAPCAAGENDVALAPGLRRERRGGERGGAAGRAAAACRRPSWSSTPGMVTVAAVAERARRARRARCSRRIP